MTDPSNPKLSVCITTYNHERFIVNAIESVLNQKTDFDYEILIGEDDSSDRTREIVCDYAKRFPEKIRIFLHRREDNLKIGGIPTGRRNFVNNLRNTRGQYVAILEADDYWTDHNKLQLQVNALDAHPNCSLCYHNALVKDESTGDTHSFVSFDQDQFVGVDEVIAGWNVPTASIVFRRGMLDGLPPWYFEFLSGDYGLQLLLADKGTFLYLNRTMSVYRKHEGGLSRFTGSIWFWRNLSMLYVRFNEHSGRRHDQAISEQLSQRYFHSSLLLFPHNRPLPALRDLYRSLVYARRAGKLSFRLVVRRTYTWLNQALKRTITVVRSRLSILVFSVHENPGITKSRKVDR